MSERRAEWLICYKRPGCIYDPRTRYAQEHDRCVKHGAILDYAPDLTGMTRQQARKYLREPVRQS